MSSVTLIIFLTSVILYAPAYLGLIHPGPFIVFYLLFPFVPLVTCIFFFSKEAGSLKKFWLMAIIAIIITTIANTIIYAESRNILIFKFLSLCYIWAGMLPIFYYDIHHSIYKSKIKSARFITIMAIIGCFIIPSLNILGGIVKAIGNLLLIPLFISIIAILCVPFLYLVLYVRY
jgi:hypothetical protein